MPTIEIKYHLERIFTPISVDISGCEGGQYFITLKNSRKLFDQLKAIFQQIEKDHDVAVAKWQKSLQLDAEGRYIPPPTKPGWL